MLRAKYAHLLEDRDVKRWFDNLAATSVITATVYLRALGLYRELNGADPSPEILKIIFVAVLPRTSLSVPGKAALYVDGLESIQLRVS